MNPKLITQRKSELSLKIKETLDYALHFKLSHEEIIEKMSQEIWNSPEYKRLPHYGREYLRGVYHTYMGYYQGNLEQQVTIKGQLFKFEDVIIADRCLEIDGSALVYKNSEAIFSQHKN